MYSVHWFSELGSPFPRHCLAMCSCIARTCQLMLGTKHTALFPLVSITLPAAVACLGRGLLFGGSSAGSLGLTARCSGLSPLSEGLPCRPQGHCVSSACSSSSRGWPSMLSSGSSSPCGWPSMSSSGSALPPPVWWSVFGVTACLCHTCRRGSACCGSPVVLLATFVSLKLRRG